MEKHSNGTVWQCHFLKFLLASGLLLLEHFVYGFYTTYMVVNLYKINHR